MKRVEGDAEGQDEGGYLHGAGADEGQGGARIAREEGGVLVEHEQAQVERDCHREHGLGARTSANAVEPEPEPEVGGDRREHDHDEARLAPAVEYEAHAEEPEIAQPAPRDEVPGEDYGQEEEEEDRRAEDHITSLEGGPARCQFSRTGPICFAISAQLSPRGKAAQLEMPRSQSAAALNVRTSTPRAAASFGPRLARNLAQYERQANESFGQGRFGVEGEALGRPGRPARDPHGGAVGLEEDGTVPVRAIDPRPCGFEAAQRLGRRVTEGIARPRRDDRDGRPRGVQKVLARGEATAVVADLEGEGAERGVGGEETLLSWRAEIARQEEREAAPVDPQHQRLLVLADGRGLIERRRTVWAEHRDESRAQPEALACGERPPAGSRALERSQGFLAARAPAPVLPELTDPHALENGAETARVIRIGMRHGHDVEARRRAVPEIGQEDALAHVETSRAAGAAVDEKPRSFGSFHEDGVALAHVEEGDTQLAIAGPHPLPERKRQDETEEPGRCDAGPAPRAEEGEKGQRRVPARDGDPSGRGQVDERGGEERRRLDGQAQGPEHEPERLEEDVRDQ